jgi:signal transduction histidine kinase
MRHFSLVIVLSLLANGLQAQLPMPAPYNEDSLKSILEGNPHDTIQVTVLLQLAGNYFFKQPDTSLLYSMKALGISRRSSSTIDDIYSLSRAGEVMRQSGMLSDAMKLQLEALELSQKIGYRNMEANTYGFIGMNYFDLKSYDKAISFLKKALASGENFHNDGTDFLFRIYIARAYKETYKPDSSFYFLAEAKEVLQYPRPPQFVLFSNALGDAFLLVKNLDSASFYYRQAFNSGLKLQNFIPNHLSMASARVASVFMKKDIIDSGFYYARFAHSVVRKINALPRILETSTLLSQLHRKTDRLDSAIYYLDIAIALNDSIYGQDKSNELQLLLLQEQKRNQETLRSEERSKSTQQLIGLVSITGVILIASILLFRNNRIKQRTNLVLQQALGELKATQSQLIQSEKMASLGELTAGIAHEIQNPLNFVNNFSELNKELIDELNQQAKEGKIEAVQRLASDIKENEEKIEHHGKRADAIVKSMLQHSRASSGQKELSDINVLCDEYVRLAYHGFRAKDKSFNVTVDANFDASLPKVNIIPQEIGRVVLNLINNAFYAVGEKAKSNVSEYTPTVKVSTKRIEGKVQIKVEDNGGGIPDAVREKIFQPFFTTKPSGQGTGLGLSLAYDIITKGHGGELNVQTEEGKGSTFFITIPLTK